MMDEHVWLKQLSNGNEEAVKKLYVQYAEKIYNTAIGYVKNTEDAEELLQDVLMTIISTAHNFRFDSSVSTWTYRITVNKSLDFLRKKNSAKRKGIFTSIYRRDSNEIQHQSIDFAHPGLKMEHKEDATLLFKMIDKLSENQKTAFILTQIEGLSQKEVAEIMKTSRKSVESFVQRAKKNLRVALEKYYPNRGKSQKNTTN